MINDYHKQTSIKIENIKDEEIDLSNCTQLKKLEIVR